ncbi:hypothetical protein BSP15_148 [Bacillus phage BSP15]|nr:hypothetical protein BSP15_148 [Bacillus phage BSP15]
MGYTLKKIYHKTNTHKERIQGAKDILYFFFIKIVDSNKAV